MQRSPKVMQLRPTNVDSPECDCVWIVISQPWNRLAGGHARGGCYLCMSFENDEFTYIGSLNLCLITRQKNAVV
jgi:hypothetical protein